MATKRRRMTASQARTFERFSVANASYVEHTLNCGCRAYEDVYTYNRWRALGYQVQRRERSIKIPVVRQVEREDEDGNITTARLLTSGAVFCRHQVKEVS